MAKKKATKQASQVIKEQQAPELSSKARLWMIVAWVVIAGLWGFVAISLVSFHPADAPGHLVYETQYNLTQNLCGPVGARISYELYLMLGIPATWFIMAGILAFLVVSAVQGTTKQLAFKALGVVMMALTLSAASTLISKSGLSDFPEGGGGLLAIYLMHHLVLKFNATGAGLILALIFMVGLVLAADQWLMRLPALLAAGSQKAKEASQPKLEETTTSFRQKSAGLLKKAATKLATEDTDIDSANDDLTPTATAVLDEPDPELTEETSKVKRRRKKKADADTDTSATIVAPPLSEDETPSAEPETVAQEPESSDDSQPIDTEKLREKFKNLPITMARTQQVKEAPIAREQDLSGYEFPGLDTLEDSEIKSSDDLEANIRQQAEILENALQNYRIEAEVVAIDSGPTITMYEIQMAPGAKVSQLNSISSDLARALRAQNIRIVPNMAGKTTVGIEVPNLEKETVRFKELMMVSGEKALAKMALPMFLGKDASGNPLVLDLAKMPHVLIAGTTGSGKSVCMNTIITSFLFARRPDELKMVLVDPKMVEMAQYKDVPHLMCPVVTEMNKAAAILEWAVVKMDERYELLAEVGKRHIDDYNSLEWDEIKEILELQTPEEEAKIPKKMPRMVFIIDELADLMMTNKEVESHIVRIAQKARAVGIHLILATQRPQANVVTGLIKSNMPCRISFKVASGMDSRIVLDTKGAELLLGQGDMMVLNPRQDGIMRAQGTFLDDMEIRRVVKFLKNIAKPSFEPQLTQLKAPGAAGGGGDEGAADRDPLFEDALRVVLESQRGSVSLLQRRLTIGYGRSSRIIEQIAEAGFLGEHKGSQAREVLMTLEEYEALQKDAAAIQQSVQDEADNLGETSWEK